MPEQTEADVIWNRGCSGELPDDLQPGDIALMDMLLLHNLTMNGGVLHAVQYLESEDFEGAIVGYQYFELDDVAEFLIEAKSISESDADLELVEAELDQRYRAYVPDDSFLMERLKASLRSNPSDFAPV